VVNDSSKDRMRAMGKGFKVKETCLHCGLK
jgi:hypothetical protein